MGKGLRVAVAGASGIGKHHARWHHAAGSEVVGFLGSSPESCRVTEEALRQQFPFAGRGYCNWQELLSRLEPEVADVCVPNELHYDCVLEAMEAGCHVLCEKPLVWHDGKSFTELLEEGRRLVNTARDQGLRLGVCTQYAAALPHYVEVYRPVYGRLDRVDSFYAEMETLARGRVRTGREIWVDMGPHPLSLLLAWVPSGRVDEETLQVEFGPSEARAVFDFVSPQGTCRSEIVVRDLRQGKPVRRFGVNNVLADSEGRPDEQGIYRCVLRNDGHEVMGEDFMFRLIAQFAKAVRQPQERPLVSGEMGLRNLELQIQVMQRQQA